MHQMQLNTSSSKMVETEDRPRADADEKDEELPTKEVEAATSSGSNKSSKR